MQSLSADKFAIPIELPWGGQSRTVVMGPFQHSPERQFTLAVQHKAIDECHDLAKMKEISKYLLESWAALNTGFQGMMLENMQLRQALAQRTTDLQAAEGLLHEASEMIQRQQKRKGWWPW